MKRPAAGRPRETHDVLSLTQRAYFLGRVPLFAALELPALVAVARIAEETTAPPGRLLFRQGDPGDALWVVLDGAVGIELDGREINVVGSGESFGEIAVLDSAPRTAAARAKADLYALRIGRQAFAQLLEARSEIRRAVLRELARRLLTIQARLTPATPAPPVGPTVEGQETSS